MFNTAALQPLKLSPEQQARHDIGAERWVRMIALDYRTTSMSEEKFHDYGKEHDSRYCR